jgi:hypothetical protein
MGKLLTAYKSLRDLENLLSLIAGIDPSNGLLSNLQHMDYLIQNLSPLYDRNLDYDKQIYTKILENDSLSIPAKAHILLGSRDENGIPDTWAELPFNELIMKCAALPEDTVQRTSVFTVENMADLLTAYYGYFNLSEAINLFVGSFPSHKILFGLSHLEDLLCDLSPLYHLEYDDDEIENEGFSKQPIMIMYHMNLSYPLIDKNCEFFVTGTDYMPIPGSEAEAEKRFEITDPVDGYNETGYLYTVKSRDGKAYAGVYNKEKKLGILISFETKNLPHLLEWKSMRSGDYAFGIMPTNCHIMGRAKENELGTLKYIDSFEKLCYNIDVTVIDGDDEYKKIINNIKEI